jgi:hypothetical protein
MDQPRILVHKFISPISESGEEKERKEGKKKSKVRIN